MNAFSGGSPRRAAAAAALLIFMVLGAILAATTPWRALPTEPADGPVRPDAAAEFTAAQLDRSAAFDAALDPPAYGGLIAGLVLVLLLALTPAGGRITIRLTRPLRRAPHWVRLGAAVLILLALLRAAGLPWRIWRENVLRDHGLSTLTWPGWAADQGRSLLVSWAIWTVAVLALHFLVRRMPRYWWTGAAAGGFGLVVAASFVYPVVVEPLFNDFEPLPHGPLRTELLRLAERDDVPVRDVLVADASRRTTALNAYVSGFGATRRIVVYDTLLASPPARVRAIVAHELGHAKRGDVLYGTLTGALGTAGAVCLLYLVLTSPRLTRRAGLPAPVASDGDHDGGHDCGHDGGHDGGSAGGPAAGRDAGRARLDVAAVPLLLASVAVLTQLGTPAQNLVSRRIESRADAHSLASTRDPATFIAMQRELATRNLSDLRPGRVEYLLWFSHPSAAERIALARTWARLQNTP